MAILNATNIFYKYKNKEQSIYAINGLNLTFEAGKLYAITGKSGSGKTTLLSLLAGLVLPTNGDVFFKDTPTSKISLDQYRLNNISMIYQNYNLFPLLTVMENVIYPLQLKNIPKKEAILIASEKILSLGLDKKFFSRFPSMLSGGEQQRVSIARALAMNSEIILADEPTGNLDHENTINIINILKNLVHTNNLCVIIATHDLTIAQEADVIINIIDGKVV